MSALRTRAPGKINVCLYVGGLRPEDARHAVVTVLQAVDLCDDVHLQAAAPGATADDVRCPGVSGPNLADAALAVFRAHTGVRDRVAVTIAKAIPVAAGMAGGSADAGAVLRLLDAHFATALGDDALRALAATLGADVPAQVRPGRHLGTGAGEVVQRCAGSPAYGVVVLPDPEPLSTPDVFREFDRLGLVRAGRELARIHDEVRAVAGDLPGRLVVNDLQPAAISLRPGIERRLERMREAGAPVALVSGSGPTVLGLTPTPAEAAAVARRLGAGAVAARTLAHAPAIMPA